MNKHVLLAHFLGINWRKYRQLLSVFSSLDDAWNATDAQLKNIGWKPETTHEFLAWKKTIDEGALQSVLDRHSIWTVPLDDPNYPALLKQVYDPPLCLFGRGVMPSGPAIAVVGSRKCTAYGRLVAEQFAEQLARVGVTIVSGLAFGIDSIAHRSALAAQGKTIAVLGGGIDDQTLHPHSHARLAHEIISSGGAVVSEYPPFTVPSKFTFPMRNRIIAGLSSVTTVIEAAEHSGALITASYALDNNREVFAVPHPITSHTGKGANLLLKSGAHIALSVDDICTTVGMATSSSPVADQKVPLSDPEKQLLALLKQEPYTIDELIRASGMESGHVGTMLSYMEIRGLVTNKGGMLFLLH